MMISSNYNRMKIEREMDENAENINSNNNNNENPATLFQLIFCCSFLLLVLIKTDVCNVGSTHTKREKIKTMFLHPFLWLFNAFVFKRKKRKKSTAEEEEEHFSSPKG